METKDITLQREFKLTDKEYEGAKAFIKEHRHPKKEKESIGGHVTLTFTPTAVGTGVRMTCGICGKSKNITDFESW